MKNERGAALLATVVIGMLLLSLGFWYFSWSWSKSRESVHGQAIQRALTYAESGLQTAQELTMMPDSNPDMPNKSGSSDMTNGRFEYTLSYDTTTPAFVEANATGYYYMPKGAFEDPLTHRPAQRAVVHARFTVLPVDAIVVAVPGSLRVNPGARVGGLIYANDLIFPQGSGDAPAMVAGAAFGQSITRDDGTADPFPSYVVFYSTPTRLSYPIRLPRLTPTLRRYYQTHATSSSAQLMEGSSLDGRVGAPPESDIPVYFCPGDLTIGRSAPFTATGHFAVYVMGELRIESSISVEGGWTVFMAEKGIRIERAKTPLMELQGTFITNGAIVSAGQHQTGNLMIKGSLLAGLGIDLATGWNGTRIYMPGKAPPKIPIPHLNEMAEYQVVQGKFK